jgi:hypothetical protein
MIYTNLVLNPSFTDGTTGWVPGVNTTISRITSDAYSGISCLALTSLASGNVWADTGPSYIPVTPGVQYAASAFVKSGRNLIANPNFETNLTGWVAYTPLGTTTTISQSTTYAYMGSVSLKSSSGSGLVGNPRYVCSTASAYATVSPSTAYTASVYARSDINTNAVIGINFRNAGGAITQVESALLPINNTSWTKLTYTSNSAIDSVSAEVVLSSVNVGGGSEGTYWDLVNLAPTSAVRTSRLRLDWYNGPTLLSVSDGASGVSTSTSSWTPLTVTATAPASATNVVLVATVDSATAASEVHYFDNVKLQKVVTSYDQTQETDITNDGMRKLLAGDIDTKPYITGLKLEGDISINGLVLNTIDQNKVVWVCTDIDGWWNLPDPEIPDIPRGLDDGSYDVRGRWKARDLTLKGSILPPTPALGATSRQTLIEALDLIYTGGWLLVNEGTLKSAYVRLYGKPTIENINARGRIDFTLPLRSADPLKYSWNSDDANGITTSNVSTVAIGNTTSTTINNSGNTNVAAVFSITGPITAPAYIKNTTTNQTIKVIKSLRDATYTKTTTDRSRTSGVSTLTTSTNHGFLVGDSVAVANVGVDTFNGTFKVSAVTESTVSYVDLGSTITSATLTSNVVTVTAASHGFSNTQSIYIANLGYPYDGTYTISNALTNTFQYSRTAANAETAYEGYASRNLTSAVDAADIRLATADTLQIDTYNTTVLYRGLPDAARSVIDVDVDWIKLQPGNNTIRIEKTAGTPASATIKYRSGWIG